MKPFHAVGSALEGSAKRDGGMGPTQSETAAGTARPPRAPPVRVRVGCVAARTVSTRPARSACGVRLPSSMLLVGERDWYLSAKRASRFVPRGGAAGGAARTRVEVRVAGARIPEARTAVL